MKNLSHIFRGLMAGALLGTGVFVTPAAKAEMATNTPQSDPRHPTLADFDLIAQRNIFDPNRGIARAQPQVAAGNRRPVVQTFSFRGAAEKVGKGFDAFFIGYGAPASGIVRVDDTINGYKVVGIGLHEVQLLDVDKDELVALTEETGLRREDGGAWAKVAAPTTYAATTPGRGASAWSGRRGNRNAFGAKEN
jgi:hypothetical protein